MAILPIRKFPDPVLKRKAKRVREIDKGLQRLIDDMFETLVIARGVGLAAPQTGISLRLCVIQLPETQERFVLVNPEIIKRKGSRVVEERCLSIPGYRGELNRAESVVVKYMDRDGKSSRLKGEELLAQALEHEIDHLDGILYIDRLESLEKLQKLEPEEETSARISSPEPEKEPAEV